MANTTNKEIKIELIGNELLGESYKVSGNFTGTLAELCQVIEESQK